MSKINVGIVPGFFIDRDIYGCLREECQKLGFNTEIFYPYPERSDLVKPGSYKMCGDKLEGEIRRLGWKELYLVNHSSGENITGEFIRSNENKGEINVKGVVSFAPSLPVDYGGASFAWKSIVGGLAGSIVNTGFFDYLRMSIEPFMYAGKEAMSLSEEETAIKELKGYDTPVRFVFSGDDIYYSRDLIDRLKPEIKKRYPGCEILDYSNTEFLKDARHGFLTEKPELAGELLAGLVAKLD